MVKLKYYFDTSILNFYIEGEITTKRMVEKIMKEGEIYISDVVLEEINRCEINKRKRLFDLVNFIQPVLLEITDEVGIVAERYIEEGIIPEKYFNDALHIAIAVVNEIDILVSWNFEHIVKLKTKKVVSGVNRILGYKDIEICFPQELI